MSRRATRREGRIIEIQTTQWNLALQQRPSPRIEGTNDASGEALRCRLADFFLRQVRFEMDSEPYAASRAALDEALIELRGRSWPHDDVDRKLMVLHDAFLRDWRGDASLPRRNALRALGFLEALAKCTDDPSMMLPGIERTSRREPLFLTTLQSLLLGLEAEGISLDSVDPALRAAVAVTLFLSSYGAFVESMEVELTEMLDGGRASKAERTNLFNAFQRWMTDELTLRSKDRVRVGSDTAALRHALAHGEFKISRKGRITARISYKRGKPRSRHMDSVELLEMSFQLERRLRMALAYLYLLGAFAAASVATPPRQPVNTPSLCAVVGRQVEEILRTQWRKQQSGSGTRTGHKMKG